jgi:uncharacterized membrane protein
MDKKTTGIVSYITLIGWLIAFCAGDKEGAKFHLNQSLVLYLASLINSIIISRIPICQRHSLHCILYFLDHGISICLQR